MKPVLRSPGPAAEDEEASAVANLESTLYEMKGCRNVRQPFFVGRVFLDSNPTLSNQHLLSAETVDRSSLAYMGSIYGQC